MKEQETVSDRVKYLRKYLGLSQESFGERLNMTKSAISKIEKAENGLSDKNFNLICSVFNANGEWLKYGIGEMFAYTTESIIEELEKKYEMGEIFKKAVIAYLNSSELTRKAIDDYLEEVFNTTIDEKEDKR